MTEERMTGKDKRAEEQALFIAWLTSLTDEEWEMFRDNIAYFQNTLAGLPVAELSYLIWKLLLTR